MQCACRALAPVRRLSGGTSPSYPHLERLQTRWNDNDGFGHVNNVLYYSFFDDAVNAHLLGHGVGYEAPRFVAESSCRYLRPLAYPQSVEVGLCVARLGSSSCSYEIGVFGVPLPSKQRKAIATASAKGAEMESQFSERFLAATGTFVHVYVDGSGRPTPISKRVREVLGTLHAE